MSFAGSVLDAIKKIRSNRELQKHTRDRYRQRIESDSFTEKSLKYNVEKFGQPSLETSIDSKGQNTNHVLCLVMALLLFIAIMLIVLYSSRFL